MEELLKQLLTAVKSLKSGQEQIQSEVSSIKSDISELKTTVGNIEGQQHENTDFIKALLHRTEELNAQAHNIGHNLNVLTGKAATKEDTAELSAKFDVLNNPLFQQEVAIHQLKAVK
ncbi:hypothetical protein [Sporomusa sp.]|uniref:hypothetical protein n=1 Tax=Sporomusa sp. TaxID=2078658 RepID=UPI002BB88727|nr:hypothetical protein [Sporomusa sp.]HWR06679.1 hypothetical protein [Sporomusa sp.]